MDRSQCPRWLCAPLLAVLGCSSPDATATDAGADAAPTEASSDAPVPDVPVSDVPTDRAVSDAMDVLSTDSGSTITTLVTFYGWADNDPPGDGIAYPTRHTAAGGVGSYDDPITVATDPT